MAESKVYVRVKDDTKRKWVAQTKALGISLSAWIRLRCNGR